MQNIIISGREWKTISDFYDSFKNCLGSPDWHGNNINALIDSVLYGDINSITPPYEIVIKDFEKIDNNLKNEIEFAISCLRDSVEEEGRGSEIIVKMS